MVEFALVSVVASHRAAVDSKPTGCLFTVTLRELHQMVVHEAEDGLKPHFSGAVGANRCILDQGFVDIS